MTSKYLPRPVAALLLVLTLFAATFGAAGSATSLTNGGGSERAAVAKSRQAVKPTIVLVHGAFADSSGWNDVATRLMNDGYPVIAFSNPLRGPSADSEYLRQFLATIPGPIVLVGHSYGGAVITNAATGNSNVKSLVYVAAYALAEGETVADANHLGDGHTYVTDHLVIRPFPGGQNGDADAYIDPEWFPRLFAPDLPQKVSRFMAATQRPAALAALVTPSGAPAWEDIPSYFVVATNDQIIPPEAERAMAERAGSTVVEISSSHAVMMTHPTAVSKVIARAATSE